MQVMKTFKGMSLKYTYNWPEPSQFSPTFLDDDSIDITNGYEMLNFINRFFVMHGLTSEHTLVRLEYMLYEHLPIVINTRKEITTWVCKNWNREFYD